MPVGILDMVIRFVKDTSDATINQKTEHMTEDTGQTIVGGLHTESVGFPDTAYDYRSITRRRPDLRAYEFFLQRGHGPYFLGPRTNQPCQ